MLQLKPILSKLRVYFDGAVDEQAANDRLSSVLSENPIDGLTDIPKVKETKEGLVAEFLARKGGAAIDLDLAEAIAQVKERLTETCPELVTGRNGTITKHQPKWQHRKPEGNDNVIVLIHNDPSQTADLA